MTLSPKLNQKNYHRTHNNIKIESHSWELSRFYIMHIKINVTYLNGILDIVLEISNPDNENVVNLNEEEEKEQRNPSDGSFSAINKVVSWKAGV